MLEITVETLQEINVIKMVGRVDSSTADIMHQQVIPMAVLNCKIILNMSEVDYMSSAGLRVLLTAYRQISGNQGALVLVGLSDELKDVMSMTGFLDYFTLQESLDMALQMLNNGKEES